MTAQSEIDPIAETFRLYQELMDFYQSIGSPVRLHADEVSTKACSLMFKTILDHMVSSFGTLPCTPEEVSNSIEKGKTSFLLTKADFESVIPGTITVMVAKNLLYTQKLPVNLRYWDSRKVWQRFVKLYHQKIPDHVSSNAEKG